MATAPQRIFDPENSYQVREIDVVIRGAGEDSLAGLVYQPQGDGTFPICLDIHGGAWHSGRMRQNVLLSTELAKAGLCVLAVDFRRAPQHPYPAQVVDVHYATRWFKAHARDYNGDASVVGALAPRAADTRYC